MRTQYQRALDILQNFQGNDVATLPNDHTVINLGYLRKNYKDEIIIENYSLIENMTDDINIVCETDIMGEVEFISTVETYILNIDKYDFDNEFKY